MKNRVFSPVLDVKYTAYLFEKVLQLSLQYSLKTKRTHSRSHYSEWLYTPSKMSKFSKKSEFLSLVILSGRLRLVKVSVLRENAFFVDGFSEIRTKIRGSTCFLE